MSKKISRVLLSVLGIASLLGQNAKADINLGLRLGFPYLTGLQFGYSPAIGTAGFGFRLSGETSFIIVNRFVASAIYQLPTEKTDNSFYFGLGGGVSSDILGVSPCPNDRCMSVFPRLVPEFHALAGFNWQFARNTALFFELSEVFQLINSKIYTTGWPFVNIGLSFRV